MQTVTIFGIPNCDSIKKTLTWCKTHGVNFSFHNYKTTGIDKKTLKGWCTSAGWEKLFNTKGTTWKKILLEYEGVKMNEAKAIDIMLEHHSIIKRPVIVSGKKMIVGFDEKALESLL